MFKTTGLHNDHIQILDKAVKYVETGEWTNYGNRATKVGSIPGSFLTAVSAIPMSLWYSPYAACAIILIFHFLSLVFLKKSADLVGLDQSLLFVLVFYWINPWRVEQSELYNPAYLFLFSSVHLYTSLKMKHKNFWLTFFHVLMIGLCFQVHFSFIILALISFFLFSTGQIKISWTGLSTATFLLLISLVPYLMDRFSDVSVIEKNLNMNQSDAFIGRNFMLVYPVLKAIIYIFRMGSLYFGRHIFSEIHFDWMDNQQIASWLLMGFKIFIWCAAFVSLAFSVFCFYQFVKNRNWKKDFKFRGSIEVNEQKRFHKYLVYMLAAVFVSAGLSPVEFNHWHFILCFPVVSLFMMTYLEPLRKIKIVLISVIVVFFIWNILVAFGSRTHSIQNDFHQQFVDHYKIKKSL